MVSVTVHAGKSVSIQGTEHSLNTKAHINVSSTEQNHKHVICGNKWNEIITVSYTHLTLPTNREV